MVAQDDIQGHWQRRWLRAPGFEDSTTRVHWMQAGGLYADIRIPLNRPDLSGAGCLADLDAPALARLAGAEGFAGHTVVADGVCTWVREINWHGLTDAIDAGRLSFDPAGDLIEDGVHADYAELWTRPATGPTEGLRLSAGEGGSAPRPPASPRDISGQRKTGSGVLVTVGARFVFGFGVPEAASSAPALAALEAGETGAEVAALFERLHVLGHWDGATGVADLATNPFLEGLPFLIRNGQDLAFSAPGFDGAWRRFPLRAAPPRADVAQDVGAAHHG